MSKRLDDALAEIRDEHRRVSAPTGLEAHLRSAVDSTRISRHLSWSVPLAAAAAVLVALFIRSHHQVPVQPVFTYIELPASAGLPAPTATAILRVQLRKADLRQYGLDVPPSEDAELMMADFVVGEDGLARAVRLVQ